MIKETITDKRTDTMNAHEIVHKRYTPSKDELRALMGVIADEVRAYKCKASWKTREEMLRAVKRRMELNRLMFDVDLITAIVDDCDCEEWEMDGGIIEWDDTKPQYTSCQLITEYIQLTTTPMIWMVELERAEAFEDCATIWDYIKSERRGYMAIAIEFCDEKNQAEMEYMLKHTPKIMREEINKAIHG